MLLTRSFRITTLSFAVVLFAALSCLTSDCQAQGRRRFVLGQELGRFLGAYHGPGYHCANSGQNTDYYNPYSAHNSQLTAGNDPYNYGGNNRGYTNFDSATVPHSVYTGQDSDQHSVFESLPGQSIQPKFEPSVDRARKQREEAEFDDDSDFDTDEGFDDDAEDDSESIFSSSSKSEDLDSFGAEDLSDALDDDEGAFDTLKESFDKLQDDKGSSPGSSLREGASSFFE